MDYYVYPLRFVTPVHFGDTAQGGTLEDTSLTFSSDSFFGACCSELAYNTEVLYSFIDDVTNGRIIMSSLFPYYIDGDNWQYYVPTPLIRVETADIAIRNFTETKIEATKQKHLKKREYMRASHVQHFSDIVRQQIDIVMPTFVEQNVTTQVNMRGPQSRPYYVGNYRFMPNAGLYVIMGFSNDSQKDFFDELIELLGYTGIGGKRSSGYGKFELADDPTLLAEGFYEDDVALYDMISTPKESIRMCMSTCVPQNAEDIGLLKEGQFKLKKRSGFVVANGASTQMKRNSYYALAEGSVCPGDIEGAVIAIESESLPYTVYRNGRGFWIGVDQHE